MSLQGILDIAIHLGTFRGIDLTVSGLYRLRIGITREGNPQDTVCPYDMSRHLNPSLAKNRDPQCVFPAEIQSEENCYVSSAFVVKYRDEFTRMNEVVHFRAEMPALEVFEAGTLMLNITLQTYKTKESEEMDMLQTYLAELPATVEYQDLASDTLRVVYPGRGVHEYFPVFFTEWNCGLLTILVHTTLLQFTYRPDQSEGEDIDLYSQLSRSIFSDIETMSPESVQALYHDHLSLLFRNHDQLLSLCRTIMAAVSRHPGKETEFAVLPAKNLMLSNLSERLPILTLETVGKLMVADISEIAASILHLQRHFLLLESQFQTAAFDYFRKQYEVRMTEHLGGSVFRDLQKVEKIPTISTIEHIGKRHEFVAAKQRLSEFYEHLPPLPVESMTGVIESNVHPILFHEQYYQETPSEDYLTPHPGIGLHLFILVHGFMGNAYDMKTIKDEIAAVHPEAVVISTNAVQGGMDSDILDMGEKLAQDVFKLMDFHSIGGRVGRISFVGHSLGGIVIRAALPYLESVKDCMYTYISLASPHLGYIASKSKMVSAGLWFIKKWKRSRCLRQLSLADGRTYQESALYRLSQHPGLQWFSHVILVSSFQDGFVPYESARVETNPGLTKKREKQETLEAMASNMISGIRPEAFHRLDVNYYIKGKSLDTMIGRRAHIQQIENSAVIRLMLHCFPGFFG